jgi:hypothetical protein
MFTRALLRIVAGGLLLTSGANATGTSTFPDADLWSLYLYEQAALVCGLALSEEQETELDEAQHRARLRLGLSQPQAAELYRQARASVLAAQESVCGSEAGPDVRVELQRLGAKPG